jgi:formimidoylglutamate deiminase
LRAATGDELAALIATNPTGPVHIHISEQVREVNDSVAFSGKRPVEWLLSHQPVDERWCLIHATHLTEAERIWDCTVWRGGGALSDYRGQSWRRACSLPGRSWPKAGALSVLGSDSNVEITAAGEIRLLEYGQRLTQRLRNVLSGGEGSTGGALVPGLCRRWRAGPGRTRPSRSLTGPQPI